MISKRNNIEVSIIIVHFNGFKILNDCLNSIGKIKSISFEVIVVDNASTDDSVIKLRKVKNNYPLKVLEMSENLGFAGGNNAAVSMASGKYLLLLNNDTIVNPDILQVLVSKMDSDKNIGAMQPKIKLMDNPQLLDNAGAFLNPLGLTVHWGYGEKDSAEFDHEREIFSAKGACIITRASLVKKIGLFDDHFGSYFEESDFCFRVWLSGYKVLYYPKTFILHKVGFTSKKMNQVAVMLMSTRNRIFSLYKNLSVLHLITILIPNIIFLKLLGIYYLLKFQPKKAWMLYGAIIWNILHFNLLISGRKQTQSLRVKTDSEIFPVIMKPLDLVSLFGHFKKVEANFKKI